MINIDNNLLAQEAFISKYSFNGVESLEDTINRYSQVFINTEIERFKQLYKLKQLKPKEFDLKLKFGLSSIGFKYFSILLNIPTFDENCVRTHIEAFLNPILKHNQYIIPGGSVIESAGLENYTSLSNCFVNESPDDSIEGIYQVSNTDAQLMKRRGGVGHDLSKIRPKGAVVHNASKVSTGITTWMEKYSDDTEKIAQDGRRGALLLSISIKHPDSEEFIKAKQDLTKVTSANVSVKISEDFMKAVEEDSDYFLRYPVDTQLNIQNTHSFYEYGKLYNIAEPSESPVYIKKIKARDLWNILIECSWKTAEPGILFEDAHINRSPDGVYSQYKMVSTNPCQPNWASVLTPEGIRTFKDINIGDIIWTEEGWSEIINKQSSGIQDVYKYHTTAGYFVGTEYHKLVSEGQKIEARYAENVDVLAGNLFCKEDPINIQDVMDGLVIGDGSIHKASNNLLYLCIGENDKDYFNSDIKDLIKEHRPGIKQYAYEVTTTILYNELPETFNRYIPKVFMTGNSAKVCGLLKGLFSANGSVVNNRITFKTTSPRLREQIQLLLSSVGIRSYFTTNKATYTRFSNGEYLCKESYDINISTDRDIFYNKIGFLQNYKMELLRNSLEFIRPINKPKNHNITKVEFISKEEVFNITVNNTRHTYWTGGLNVANCGEIGMQPFDSCRLIHHNYLAYNDLVTIKSKSFSSDYDKLSEIFYIGGILGDVLVDMEIAAIETILKKLRREGLTDTQEFTLWTNVLSTTKNSRRCGVGFTGFFDFAILQLYKAELEINMDNIITIADMLSYRKLQSELCATNDLAILFGPFYGWKSNLEFTINDDTGNIIGNNEFFEFVRTTYPNLISKLSIYGRRNISMNTVAPTGTVSILLGCTSGIEPLFDAVYERKRKVTDDSEYDYIDNVGIKFKKYIVIHPPLQKWIENTYGLIDIHKTLKVEEILEYYQKSPWYKLTAFDIPVDKRLELQAVVQKYTTHSISSTINLPESTTISGINDLFINAWKLQLKGVTVYRDGCRSGIMTTINKRTKAIRPIRPKKLPAKMFILTRGGIKYGVIIGLFNNEPYEIFAIELDKTIRFNSIDGEIIKVKKGCYSFTSSIMNIDNLQMRYSSTEQRFAVVLSSICLGYGIPIDYIIKTLDKIDDGISSFSKALQRVLSNYLPTEILSEKCPNPDCNGKLIRENGCVHCSDCSYSRC